MKMLKIVLIIALSIGTTKLATAQTYSVILNYAFTEVSGNKTWQTPSEITIKTDNTCSPPNRINARLDTQIKKLTYTISEPYIDADYQLDYVDKEVSCNVIDWMGVPKSNIVSINSNVRYELQYGLLTLDNILIMDGFDYTGLTYSKAVLLLRTDGLFELQELIQ